MSIKGYRCFENDKKEYLMSKGFEYITIALDPKSHEKFWLFIINDELNKAILEWKHMNR